MLGVYKIVVGIRGWSETNPRGGVGVETYPSQVLPNF